MRGKETLVSGLILEVNWEGLGSTPKPTRLVYPLLYHFCQTRYPFYIPSIENWCLLNIPANRNLLIIAGEQKRARRRTLGGVVSSNL